MFWLNWFELNGEVRKSWAGQVNRQEIWYDWGPERGLAAPNFSNIGSQYVAISCWGIAVIKCNLLGVASSCY